MEGLINIGIVGAGGFADFAARAFLKSTMIRLIAVTDLNKDAASRMGKEFGMLVYDGLEQLLADENIRLVYIATPPFLHYAQSRAALMGGKHVICEKPAALSTAEAEELLELARSLQLLYVVNLMQRYNPAFKMVKTIIEEEVLGNFLHGFFENYATDENLPSNHWFWDESKSGGIFIEHAVHFFDLFEGWLGSGRVIGAWQLFRPSTGENIVDRVQATVRYEKGMVNFYHGFDQPKMLDRQEMRLQFEFGEITLYGWVPVKLKLHGLLVKGQLIRLQEIIGFPVIIRWEEKEKKNELLSGRYRDMVFEDHITLEYENTLGKQLLYQELLSAMITDQTSWIKNHGHTRTIDDTNGVQSLRTAEHANRMAKNANIR
jgi:predicted dehydrogenase